MALGDRRSEITTAGNALGCARGRHPRLGLAVRCGDLALSLKKHHAFYTLWSFWSLLANMPFWSFLLAVSEPGWVCRKKVPIAVLLELT